MNDDQVPKDKDTSGDAEWHAALRKVGYRMEPVIFGAERVHHMDAAVKPYVLYITLGEDEVNVEAKSHKVEKRREEFRVELSVEDFAALRETLRVSNAHLDFFDNQHKLWGVFPRCFGIGMPIGKDTDAIPGTYAKTYNDTALGLDAKGQTLRDLVHWHCEVPMDDARWTGLQAVLDTVLRDSHSKGSWTDGNPMNIAPGTTNPVLTP